MAIAYKDASNSGQFSIYQPDGTKVMGPIQFEGENPLYISISQLSNGWLVISYSDQDNSGYLTTVIYGAP